MKRRRSPARRLGQNFLIDRGAVRRIVEAAGVERGEALLEIGPGKGALTVELVERAGRVAAVELDARLASALEQRFDPSELLLLREDVLRTDLGALPGRLGVDPGRRLVVVGNLPYQISKPVAMKLIRERDRVARAVLMFQREVATRLTATPGTRAYGPLTVLAGLAYDIEGLFDLGPNAFRPRPAVVSRVTRWRRRAAEELTAALEPSLRACLAACFASRRRTLRNNLRGALEAGEAERLLEAAQLSGGLRAEEVPPPGFVRLARLWPRGRTDEVPDTA